MSTGGARLVNQPSTRRSDEIPRTMPQTRVTPCPIFVLCSSFFDRMWWAGDRRPAWARAFAMTRWFQCAPLPKTLPAVTTLAFRSPCRCQAPPQMCRPRVTTRFRRCLAPARAFAVRVRNTSNRGADGNAAETAAPQCREMQPRRPLHNELSLLWSKRPACMSCHEFSLASLRRGDGKQLYSSISAVTGLP